MPANFLRLLVCGGLTASFALSAPQAAAAAPSKASQRAADLDRHLRMTQFLLDSGDFAYAQKEAAAALALDKRNLLARRLLVAALGRAQQFARALKVVDALAAELPGDLWAAQVRCEILTQMGDKTKALAAWEALATLPDAPAAAHYRAAVLLDALRTAGEATATPRQRGHLLAFLRSREALSTPDGKDAERMLLEIEKGEMGRMFFAAREHYFAAFRTGGPESAGHLRQAEAGLRQTLTLDPKFQPAHAFLGMCLASVKASDYDLKAAEAELRQAPDIAEAWFALGRLLRDSERLGEAALAFETALKLEPRHSEAGYQLGVVYKVVKRRADALRVFEAVVSDNPQSAAASRALSELQALAPDSQVVARYSNRLASPPDADLFSTERYKAGVQALEQWLLGGVDEGAEVVWLEKMMRRLVQANDLSPRVPLRVKLGKTEMVNAFATPHGNIYFTKGFLAHIKKRWPAEPLDESNSYIAAVMAHEITHVIKSHIISRDLFQKSLQQAGKQMDPTIFRLTTRLNEIEADREGFLYMLAAGYNPNAMLEWMEAAAADLGDPPPMEDHPTFDERVTFLADFWTGEVRFAYQAFETGTEAALQGQKLEHKDLAAAKAQYELAALELDRFVRFFRNAKEAWNNLASVQAKLGVLAEGDASPLARWYTPLSIERTLALQLPGMTRKKRGAKDAVFLARAKENFGRALALDANYGRALVNLAAVDIGLGDTAGAEKLLAQAEQAAAEPVLVATLRGVIAAEAGKWDAAVAAFQRASQDGNDPRALYCLALALQQKGDKPGALTAFSAFLGKEDKDSPWAAQAQRSMSALAP